VLHASIFFFFEDLPRLSFTDGFPPNVGVIFLFVFQSAQLVPCFFVESLPRFPPAGRILFPVDPDFFFLVDLTLLIFRVDSPSLFS